MNDQEKRIKLALLMGWKYQEAYHCWTKPDGSLLPREFDPFTDANDDYAVLEWVRTQDELWTDVHDYLCNVSNISNYKIGDYARAALKVIE